MIVAIVTTGDELTNGELVDTNSAWLAQRLFALGLEPSTHIAIPDNPHQLSGLLEQAPERWDAAIFSGGLGPTEDDVTVEVVAQHLGREVVLHEPSLNRARLLFARHHMEFSPNNEKQAAIPKGVTVLDNPVGLAPGFACDIGTCRCYFLPGVPREFQHICRESVLPDLAERVSVPPHAFRTIKLMGIAESHLARDVEPLLAEHPDVRFGTRAHFPEVWFKMRVPGTPQEAAWARMKRLTEEFTRQFGHRVFGFDDETLESAVARLLAARGLTLATAESCTGGLVGRLLTNVPGISQWYVGGGITYSNALKEKLLGVPADLLARHGAVSEECARAMAEGARTHFGADLAVSITGIAGPDGGTPDKPVGTVHFGLATPHGTRHKHRLISRDREQVRQAAAATALNLVRLCLLEGLP